MEVIWLLGLVCLWMAFLTAGVFYVLVELRAMQKSTHQITYMNPLEAKEGFEGMTDELKESLTKEAYDNIN